MPEKAGEIWLVRHPRPVVPSGLCYGALDIEADSEDTARSARELAATVPQGAVVRCSPALRCRQLADALMALRPDLRAAGTHAWLREMGLGDWEGRRWDEIPPEEMRAWTDDFACYQTGGGQGESVAQFLERIKSGLCATQGGGAFPAVQGLRLLPALQVSAAVAGQAAGAAHNGSGKKTDRQGQVGRITVCITHAGVIRGVVWLLGGASCHADADHGFGGTGKSGFGTRLPAAHEWPAFDVGYGEAWRVGRSM